MANQDLKYWLAIARIGKIGAARFKRLYNFFPDMKTAWLDSSATDLTEAGLDPNLAEEFLIRRRQIDPDLEMANMEKEAVQAITIFDSRYPKLLKEIYDAPALLFYRGEIEKINEYTLAVVGTRKVSTYGKQVTQEIVRDLVKNEITIVSGLALGVDAEAHLACVENKKQTIAVIGSGLDRNNIYPTSNRYIADQILANNGIIISEYPIGTLPLKQNFPARNRIISGLSLGTIVIEAGENSGALITAASALEQNREVFAVPGNIFNEYSKGTNNLIKQGANLVMRAEDILEILNLRQIADFKISREILPDSPEEAKLLKFLSKEPMHIDALAKFSKMNSQTVNSTLTMMELKGKVKNIGNMSYVIG